MHLLYFDEVKYDPPQQESYWLGGICVSEAIVPEIESAVSDVCERALGSPLLEKKTELHGIELCRGNGNFKGRPLEERLSFLAELLAIIGREDVLRIRVKINPQNIAFSAEKPADIAFMYFVEQADQLFSEQNSLGMLFGDYDEPAVGSSVASLSAFRKGGTRWARAKEIAHTIDTVHFAKSHHSRMIQLADIYLYCTQFMWQDNTSSWRKAVADIVRASGILRCRKQRDWPSEPHWYRR